MSAPVSAKFQDFSILVLSATVQRGITMKTQVLLLIAILSIVNLLGDCKQAPTGLKL